MLRTIHSLPQMPLKGSWIAIQDRHDYSHDAERYYNRRAKDLKPLAVGKEVYVQDDLTHRWDKAGTVVELHGPRSYLIRLPSGRTLVRNRRFLRLKPVSGDRPQPTTLTEETKEKKSKLLSQPKPDVRQQPRRSTRQSKKPKRLNY